MRDPGHSHVSTQMPYKCRFLFLATGILRWGSLMIYSDPKKDQISRAQWVTRLKEAITIGWIPDFTTKTWLLLKQEHRGVCWGSRFSNTRGGYSYSFLPQMCYSAAPLCTEACPPACLPSQSPPKIQNASWSSSRRERAVFLTPHSCPSREMCRSH